MTDSTPTETNGLAQSEMTDLREAMFNPTHADLQAMKEGWIKNRDNLDVSDEFFMGMIKDIEDKQAALAEKQDEAAIEQAAQNAALDAEFDSMCQTFKTEPQSMAGAVNVLKLMAEHLKGDTIWIDEPEQDGLASVIAFLTKQDQPNPPPRRANRHLPHLTRSKPWRKVKPANTKPPVPSARLEIILTQAHAVSEVFMAVPIKSLTQENFNGTAWLLHDLFKEIEDLVTDDDPNTGPV